MKKTIITVTIVLVIAAIYFFSRGNSASNPANQNTTNNRPSNQSQGIQNDSDLISAATDLDNTDLNSMDSDLNQNDIDASTF